MNLVGGVGVNDSTYPVTVYEGRKQVWMCPFYKCWKSMLIRTNNKIALEHRPNYKNVTVCKEWLTFSNFRNWMVDQDWEGNVLDKDLSGNNEYSPENCNFISQRLNSFISKKPDILHRNGKYLVRTTNPLTSERRSFGTFLTMSEAISISNKKKLDIVEEFFKMSVTPKVYNLLNKMYGE